MSALPGRPAAPWTKEGAGAAPLAPALPRSSGNTPRVKGEGDTGQQNGLSGAWGGCWHCHCFSPSFPTSYRVTSAWMEQPDQAQNPSCLHWPPRKQPRAHLCSKAHQAWPRVFLIALSTGRAAALTSAAGWGSCSRGHHPGPSLTLLMLCQSLGGEGCPEGVHNWLAGKAGEPQDSTQSIQQHSLREGRRAWSLAGVSSGAGYKRKDTGSQI